MNITFFIGNGFDINLGLQTRYSCFYPYFIEHARTDNMIRNWINGNEQLWSDLEEKLGKELKKVSEDKLEQLYEDKEELDRLLIEYLEKEQKKYVFKAKEEIIKKEFTRSMTDFLSQLSANDEDSLKATMAQYRNEEFVYSYVTFNYTDVLDKIIALYGNASTIASHQSNSGLKSNRIGKVIHIHGTTNEEMILGVNDESQIESDYLKSESLFLDTFIKKRMNNGIGQRKTESVIDVINKSHIVCVFGMSIGNTDKMWWEELIKWLGSNENNKLVIFWKGFVDVLNRRLPSTTIRLNEKLRREIFQKGKGINDESYYSKIKDRIMISYNANIFSFPKLQEESRCD